MSQPIPGPDPEPIPLHPRDLLTSDLYAGVMATVIDNNAGMAKDMAERVVDEGLKFVATAARFPNAAIAPSRVVDEGWHALILHTALYADLCDRLGRFVHHYPERPDSGRFAPDIIERTIALIGETGYAPDRDLWSAPNRELIAVAANCQHSPPPGPIQPMPTPQCLPNPEAV